MQESKTLNVAIATLLLIFIWALSFSSAAPNLTRSPSGISLTGIKKFESSPYYLPPFDSSLGDMNQEDLEKLRHFAHKIIDYYRQDITNYLSKRSFSLGSLIKPFNAASFYCGTVREFIGLKMGPVHPFSPIFEKEMQRLIESLTRRVETLVYINNYNKKNVNKAELLQRVNTLFDYFEGIVDNTPVGFYLQWDLLNQSKNLDNPDDPFDVVDRLREVADIALQLKALDYFAGFEKLAAMVGFFTGSPSKENMPTPPEGLACPVSVSN